MIAHRVLEDLPLEYDQTPRFADGQQVSRPHEIPFVSTNIHLLFAHQAGDLVYTPHEPVAIPPGQYGEGGFQSIRYHP